MNTTKEQEESTNLSIRLFVLVFLCCQNAGHALLARYSQGILKEKYSSTEVVIVAEVIKFFVSGYFSLIDKSETDAIGNGFYKLLWLLIHSRKIILLVVLYGIGNLLSYYALARVDASVYSVMLQLKILTTAAFAVVFLGRNISNTKWRALFLLVIGCVLVASPAFNRPVDCDSIRGGGNDDERVSALETISGVVAVLIMVTTSGYSAVYFEGMLKKVGEKVTIWERNFQLAFYSAVLLLCVHFYEKNDGTLESLVMFKGWTTSAVIIAIIQAFGGLLVAATLKYADAILKTLATSGSIVLSAVLGYMLLGGSLDIFVGVGCVATILAIFNYTLDAS